jgi:hypothetical protein
VEVEEMVGLGDQTGAVNLTSSGEYAETAGRDQKNDRGGDLKAPLTKPKS